MYLFLGSLLMAFVPARKGTEAGFRNYVHVSGGVITGLLEINLAAWFWFVGLFEIGAQIAGSAVSEGVSASTSNQMGGMMTYVLALFSNAIRPTSFLWMITFFDGFIRVADALVNKVHRGLWFVDLGDFVFQKIKASREKKRVQDALGVGAPDELVLGDEGSDVLDFFTSQDPGFSATQSACYRAEMYTLESCELVPRGEVQMFRCRFRRLPASEVARGKVIQFD